LPLVWVLTSARYELVYNEIFSTLKSKAEKYRETFALEFVYLDFEQACINAVESEFPAATIRGCWFHYTQCLYRKIQKLGLSTLYEENDSVCQWLRSFMDITLIDGDVITGAITLLRENLPSDNGLPAKFLKYFDKQWVQKVSPKYWNLGPHHLRTNNLVEGNSENIQHWK
ncbi:unnamed protein product, partial [Didymodactylos carnosus]